MDRKIRPEWAPFGAGLQRLRKERKLNGAQVAKAINVSPAMYSAIERGKRFCVLEHVAKLDELFGTGDEVLRMWTKMNNPDNLPDWYYKVPELERAAMHIREYQPLLVPGLLQTPAYTKAMVRAARPWTKEADIGRLLEARSTRWQVLESDDRPLLWFVLTNSVLESPVGTDRCMREQLSHLATLVEDEKILLQVLPARTRNSPGKDGPFRIYSFPDKPTVASAEHMTGEIVIDDPVKLQQCEVTYGSLQASALGATESLAEILKTREKFDER